MSKSKIDWADKVWNPTTGCTMGCSYCYAAKMAVRLKKMGLAKYRNAFIPTCHAGELDKPLHWLKPSRVFVNSMGDLFDPAVPVNFIEQVFEDMFLAEWHTFTILTKNSERMGDIMSNWLNSGDDFQMGLTNLPNVWLGVTITRQEDIRRWWDLYYTSACNRFISFEPLLGPFRFDCIHCHGAGSYDDNDHTRCPACNGTGQTLDRLDWVIAGGQNGIDAQPMHPDWVRGLRDDCQAASVPFFFKGWGEWAPQCNDPFQPREYVFLNRSGEIDQQGDKVITNSGWSGMGRVGKKAAGHLLDGHEWREFPTMNHQQPTGR